VEVSLAGFNLDIIIPVYNEGEHFLPWLQEVAGFLQADDRIVVVDASDQHAVSDIVSDYMDRNSQVHYVKSSKGRALQMNAGVEWLAKVFSSSFAQDNQRLLWFLHCDSGLSAQHLAYLRSLEAGTVWGRFDVQLAPSVFPFGMISWFINVRSRLTQVMTGDQGIFVRSDIFNQLKGYAQIPLMEDVEISKRLRKRAKADSGGPTLQTSARRWQQYGWVKTVLLMWQLRLLYWLGASPNKLVDKYYGK
jgi:rSAM/selenodomain-associated transferase 2